MTARTRSPIGRPVTRTIERAAGPEGAALIPTSKALLRAGFAGNRHYPPSWVEAANSPGPVVIGSATPVSASQWSFCRTGGRATARPPGIHAAGSTSLAADRLVPCRPADRRCGSWTLPFSSVSFLITPYRYCDRLQHHLPGPWAFRSPRDENCVSDHRRKRCCANFLRPLPAIRPLTPPVTAQHLHLTHPGTRRGGADCNQSPQFADGEQGHGDFDSSTTLFDTARK